MESCKTKNRKIIYLDFSKNIYKVFDDSRTTGVFTKKGMYEKHKKEGRKIVKESQSIECGELALTDNMDSLYNILDKLSLSRDNCAVFAHFKNEEQFLSKI